MTRKCRAIVGFAIFALSGLNVMAQFDIDDVTSQLENTFTSLAPLYIDFTVTNTYSPFHLEVERRRFEDGKTAGAIAAAARWDPAQYGENKSVTRYSFAELPNEIVRRVHKGISAEVFTEIVNTKDNLSKGLLPDELRGSIHMESGASHSMPLPWRLFDTRNLRIWDFCRSARSSLLEAEGGELELRFDIPAAEIDGQPLRMNETYILRVNSRNDFWPTRLTSLIKMANSKSGESIGFTKRIVVAEDFKHVGPYWFPMTFLEESRDVTYEYKSPGDLPTILKEGTVRSGAIKVNNISTNIDEIRKACGNSLSDEWKWPSGTNVYDDRDGKTYIGDQQGVLDQLVVAIDDPQLPVSKYSRSEAEQILNGGIDPNVKASGTVWKRILLITNVAILFFSAGWIFTRRVVSK